MKVVLLFAVKVFLFSFMEASEKQMSLRADEPKFLSVGINATVVEGREVVLPCVVDNLGNHKVAWLRVDTQTILTIGPHVITKNHRVAVGRGDAQSWALAIKDARPADGGRYMCQVNTEPMITQTHYLDVLVPPDIVESDSEVLAQEGDEVNLHCQATGRPMPTVTWRREDSRSLIGDGETTVSKWNGQLHMSSVRRKQSGAYLCIATNGVPPTVSKRILLHVLCKPSVRIMEKMITGYVGDTIVVECSVEAYPQPIVHWSHTGMARIRNGSKYQSIMTSQDYKYKATLFISQLTTADVGTYYCHAENSLGTARDHATVYTISTTYSQPYSSEVTVMPTTIVHTEHVNSNETVPSASGHEIVLSQHQMQNIEMAASS